MIGIRTGMEVNNLKGLVTTGIAQVQVQAIILHEAANVMKADRVKQRDTK